MKKLLLLVLLMPVLNIYAQKSLNKDFIINAKGDTIYGKVSIPSKDFKEIKFEEAGQSHSYTAKDIKGLYDSTAGLYITSKVILDVSKNDLNLKTDSISVFLETVIRANELEIYYFRNSQYGKHYFLRKGNEPLQELIHREKNSEVNGKTVIISDDPFKQILANALGDCKEAQQAVKNGRLSHRSLQSVLVKYASCRSQVPQYKSIIHDKGKMSLGVTLAWYNSTFKYSNVDQFFKNGDFTKASGITVGISADYFFSSKRKTSSILNELVYKSMDTKSTINFWYGTYAGTFQLDYLRVNTLFKYQFRTSSVRPFLNFGISNSFLINSSNSFKYTDAFNGNVSYSKRDVKGSEQGFLFGGGINYKSIDLIGRLETSSGFISSGADDIKISSIYVGLTYKFN